MTQLEAFATEDRWASISHDGLYRYGLTRQWADGDMALFIMLNPSTADADQDDPTIRRCRGFAKREGCGGFAVVNLFAYRATNPKELLDVADPVGPENVEVLTQWLNADDVRPHIAAWGAGAGNVRLATKRPPAEAINGPLECLGITKGGHPKHPLYVPANAPLIPWRTR